MGYALYAEYSRVPTGLEGEIEVDAEIELEKLRIVSVRPDSGAPGAAVFIQFAGGDPANTDELYAEIGKQPATTVHRTGDQLVVRVPAQLPLGVTKLRVVQGERRSKPWPLRIAPLPRGVMLRDALGGLALFVLGLGTVGRGLRAYAGRKARAQLALLTQTPARAAGFGAIVGLATQVTTSASAFVASLLGARMLPLTAAVVALLAAQLGAAGAAVLVPGLATREALWVVVIGALGVLLAEDRLTRALAAAVVGAGLIFHGLGLLQSGCAPLISDPQIAPYLWHVQGGGLRGMLSCAALGALLTALLQGPAPVFSLALNLVRDGLLSAHEALALLSGVSLGALVNTFVAAWAFGADARRMARVHLALAPVMTLVALCGLPVWDWLAAISGGRDETGPGNTAHFSLGLGFVALQLCACAIAYLLSPLALRASAGRSLRESSRPPAEGGRSHELQRALALCRRGLSGVREVIASSDRSSAAASESALREAAQVLSELLRSRHGGQGGHAGTGDSDEHERATKAASVAALHLCDALLAALRVAEKAPELGLVASGEAAAALERLHSLLDAALADACAEFAAGRVPKLSEAQAREIEINAAEAEIRQRLFEVQSSGEELALRLWSSELCAAYETVGNQMYRAISAVAADDD